MKKYFGVNSFLSKTFNYCDFFYTTSTKYGSYLNQPAKFGLALSTKVENDSATVQCWWDSRKAPIKIKSW